MKINWKVRFRNRAWLAAFLATVVAFLYDLLALFEVLPPIAEGTLLDALSTILHMLTLLGVVVDPTTEGVGDSERALEYQ